MRDKRTPKDVCGEANPSEAIHDVEVAVEVFSKFKKGKLNCRT